MLAVVQFPIADSRPFLPDASGRLTRPDWPPLTRINPQFVRRFGSAADRRNIADKAWADEHAFCHASHALAFVELPARLGRGRGSFAPAVAFRRLLVDESHVVGRVEVGIASGRTGGHPRFDQAAGLRAITDILELQTKVPDDHPRLAPLITQGTRLARLYLRASTRNGVALADHDDRIVEAGEALVVVTFDKGELDGQLQGFRNVRPEHVGGAELGFRWIKTKSINGPVGTWLIRPGTAPSDTVRRLRLCLMRLHAERECMDSVLRQIQREAIHLDGEAEDPERLQQFLNDATRLISRDSWNGFSQSAILAAFDAWDVAEEPDELSDLIERLERARRQVAEKAIAYARRRAAPRVVQQTVVQGDQTLISNTITGGIFNQSPIVVGQMDNVLNQPQQTNVDPVTINPRLVKEELPVESNSGPVTITSTISGGEFNASPVAVGQMENALNNFHASLAADDLKNAVTDLNDEAKKLMARLDRPTADEVADSVKLITEQASKPNPTQALVKAAAEGVIKIGRGIDDLSEPISRAINGVLSLLKIVL